MLLLIRKTCSVAFLLLILTACGLAEVKDSVLITPDSIIHLEEDWVNSLPLVTPLVIDDEELGSRYTPGESATLRSLKKINEYPLYTMTYYSDYQTGGINGSLPINLNNYSEIHQTRLQPAYACSLFVSLTDPNGLLYGRNFDWQYSPALFLYTNPPDGYASVSMVNMAFIHSWDSEIMDLENAPLDEIVDLLQAPRLPIDGMNERGLVVGMAAVPDSPYPYDAARDTISSLGIIREMLDHAKNVDEAIDILSSYNVDWSGGPPIHYLIADRLGDAVLVEFFQGEMVVIPDNGKWHQATNFLVSSDPENPLGRCWRYDTIHQQMKLNGGIQSSEMAMALLAKVAQEGTQWSVVYDLGLGEVHIVMGKDYDQVITLSIHN